MRRLLSLDFVLEHPGMKLAPRRAGEDRVFLKSSACRSACFRAGFTTVWSATRSATLRSNCPLPWTLKPSPLPTSDPGHQTDRELYSWGAAHGPLWDALRKKGRQVRVLGIAVENATLDRTARVLERWAAADPGDKR